MAEKYDSVIRRDDFQSLLLNLNKHLDRWEHQVGSERISFEVRERGKFHIAGALN